MPVKASRTASRLSQQSTSPAAVSRETAESDSLTINSKSDNTLTTVSSGSKRTPAYKETITAGNEVQSAKNELRSGAAPSASRAKSAAQSLIKTVKSINAVSAIDMLTVSSQQSKVSLFDNISSATNSPAKLAVKSESDRRSAFQRTGAHRSAWAARTPASLPAPVVNINTEDQVYKYGLYLLRPEIITLFDSDPLNDGDTLTNAGQFLRAQFATAKSLQEASYRRTRGLLSSLSYLTSLGFSESDLRPLDAVSSSEREGTSLFEQTVSKWDSDYADVLRFGILAFERSIAAQNIVSSLNIANMRDRTEFTVSTAAGVYASMQTLAVDAVQSVTENPTAMMNDLAVAGVQYEPHGLTRDTDSGEAFISRITNSPSDINATYSSYALMHTLLQQSFLSFAVGNPRDQSTALSVDRSRNATNLQSVFKHSISTSPLGKIVSGKTFSDPLKFADDAYDLSLTISPENAAKVLLNKLSGIASYNASALYSEEKTALDIFREKIGLPIGLSDGEQGTGDAISDFERASAQSTTNLLFQVAALENTSLKLMFFDRSHNPGLPSGYTHGYTRLFGDVNNAADVATDLITRATKSLANNNSIDKKILSSETNIRGRTTKSADLFRVVLEKYASLLVAQWDPATVGASSYTDFQTSGFSTTYASYVKYAGVASPLTRTPLKVVYQDPSRGQSIADRPREAEFLPVYVDLELLYFMAMNLPFQGYMAEWSKNAVNVLMTYWSQRFDYEVGLRDSLPDSMTGKFYNLAVRGVVENYKQQLIIFYGTSTNLVQLDLYAADAMDRIVSWSITTAKALFSSAERVGTRVEVTSPTAVQRLPSFSSLLPNADGSIQLPFKQICLLLTSFACFHTRSIFDRTQYRSAIPSNPYTRFSDSAGQIVNELVSHVPSGYDNARLCLGIVNAQLKSLVPGLKRMTTLQGSDADLLTDGKFNLVYTPCQAAGMSIRKHEFLHRRARAPFHSPRYDETSSVRAMERTAIRSLYRTPLMGDQDTRMLVVGLPAGIQHVVGLDQRYAKMTVTRRDQAETASSYTKLTFIFDMLTFISPDTSSAIGNSPFTATSGGDVSGITDINFFRLNAGSAEGIGGLTSYNCSSISPPNLTRPLREMDGAGKVQVSDFIAEIEFIDDRAAAGDLGTTADQLGDHPAIIGNHFVDYLLKTHMRNVSGLDLSESTFTTSASAFSPSTTENIDEARSYVFNICTLDFLTDQSVGSANFEASVRHLDVLSRTPLIRSNSYADLCKKSTYFDRVFAVPINMKMFERA